MNIPWQEIFDRLLTHFGPQSWWPADSTLEVIVGTVLTQNTSWRNVERAIAQLKSCELLTLERLATISLEELADVIRPAGYFRVKAQRIKHVVAFIQDRAAGNIEQLFTPQLAELRRDLLNVNGVGPETADSILLYAGSLPSFVVDAYTRRIWSRHGWLPEHASYEQIQAAFHAALPADAALYNEYHALIVQVGKHFCRPTPRCAGCPLECWLR